MSRACAKLLQEADKLIAMAEDLRNRGFAAEAVAVARIAAQRLRAIRALEKMDKAAGVPR